MNAFDATLAAHQAYHSLAASPLAQAAHRASTAHFGGMMAELAAANASAEYQQGYIHGARGDTRFADSDGAYGAGYAAGKAAGL